MIRNACQTFRLALRIFLHATAAVLPFQHDNYLKKNESDRNMEDRKTSPLQILIVHESTVIRNILREYICTDHPDAAISFCASRENLDSLLETKPFDLVFSGLEMERINGFAVHEGMQESARNRKTPLIIMTPTDTPVQRNYLAKRGLRHVLPIPCTSLQLRDLMYRIFNPESNTIRTFYAMPESSALIHMENQQIPAEIINISTDSIICGLRWTAERNALTKADLVTLHFPADYGKASTISIAGQLLGIKDIIRVHTDHPDRLRVNWRVSWHLFELQAATKRPVRLRMGEHTERHSEAEENQAEITESNLLLSRENESLKTALDMLTMEKENLLQKISRLRKKISDLEKTQTEMMFLRRADGTLINEAPVQTQDSRKLSIFKRIIEDNIKLRC
ncbi:MAG: response regulator [Desulfobacterales bacterium]